MPHPAAPPLILPLHSPLATLDLAGGKGANLSLLIRAGFPVPGGFIVTTAAYDDYLGANGLRAFLTAALADLAFEQTSALEAASVAIRARFAMGAVPPALATVIREAYLGQPVGHMSVAVRSSATTEDLPDLSFAGQQDTFLNVVGPEALLRAVVQCWSSLWTARAIGYRARNGIPNEAAALAVVVQTMVDAEAAGVLFTANPLNGRRTESVVDATLGLGEGLVSGHIEPDQYVVQTATGAILHRQLGAKQGNQQDIQALPDAALGALVALGARIQDQFETPQDVEWAWAGGELSILQARPITSLYPLPEGMDPLGELHVLGSVGAFQGVLDPFTPLGQDALRALGARVADILGYGYTYATLPAVRTAGERLFIDLTGPLRHRQGRRLVSAALGQIEPGMGVAVRSLFDDPRLSITSTRPGIRLARRLLGILAPLAVRFLASLVRPEANRASAQKAIEEAVVGFAAMAATARTLEERLRLFDALVDLLRQFLLVHMLPRFVPGMFALNQLYRLAASLPDGPMLALEITRGLPHNVTTEMDLALWDSARRIRADAKSAARFETGDSEGLAQAYLAGALPPVAQEAAGQFMSRYGIRGLGEIDLGRPRWREEPGPVMDAIRSYLRIDNPQLAPDAVFARGAASSAEALERLVAELRRTKGGPLKAHRARWAARRVRALAGMRETPKFTIIRCTGIIREALLKSGQELAARGVIEQPADLFYLGLGELHQLAAMAPGAAAERATGLRDRIAEHRARFDRERRRRQVPRVLLSDGQAFYEGATPSAGDAGELTGTAVSPGAVEGRVRVVFDPAGAQLQPGEILVCLGTDPSWTPLFLAAAGLVMEVGGMMTHGSVVAREYGIPAVVGVTQATQLLKTGQRIRVDGSAGRVMLLDRPGG